MNKIESAYKKMMEDWEMSGEMIAYCMKDKALEIERELTAVTEQRDQWKDKYIQQNKDLGHELRDPNGTIWSECKRLQTELDAVTEQRDGLRSGIDYASDQLHTVTEQRDELLRYNEAFRKETLICADCDAIRKEEYDQAIEQRDRLAEALKGADECLEMANFSKYEYTRRMITEALQSLTKKEQ
jgi:septal ring factor EnvC (AmiA/AmiB activator)